MRILLLGSIGSGKSTQAQILSKDLNFCLIRSGDLVRELAKTHTADGRACLDALKSGHLAPDRIVSALVKQKVNSNKDAYDFIFDGFVRRLSQLKLFDPKYDLVVYLKLSEEEVLKRLKKRNRRDDTPQIISERIKVYHQETEPLIEYYQKRNLLKVADASFGVYEVTKKLKEMLENEG